MLLLTQVTVVRSETRLSAAWPFPCHREAEPLPGHDAVLKHFIRLGQHEVRRCYLDGVARQLGGADPGQCVAVEASAVSQYSHGLVLLGGQAGRPCRPHCRFRLADCLSCCWFCVCVGASAAPDALLAPCQPVGRRGRGTDPQRRAVLTGTMRAWKATADSAVWDEISRAPGATTKRPRSDQESDRPWSSMVTKPFGGFL